MKRKIVVIMGLIILTSLGLIFILNNKNKHYEITDDNNGQFAFFYEDENGEYQRSTDSKWDSGKYILNLESSTCDGENNPSFLTWNNDNNSVTLTRNKATKCSLYFDIKTFDMDCDEDLLSCFIAKKQGTKVGNNNKELIYHNGLIDVDDNGTYDDAGDLSYRYSGDNPDNFVCFGTDQSPCPVKNLYRIIGVFPVTKEDGSIEYQVKLIKSEYITQEELGINSYTQLNMNNSGTGMNNISPRVQKTENVDQFRWIDTNPNNNWYNSPINIALNNHYYNSLGSKWQTMIATTNWFIGGVGDYVNTSIKNFYLHELGSERLKNGDVNCVDGNNSELTECKENLLESKAKIGLMYVSDYLYTSVKSNWNLLPKVGENGAFASIKNRSNNWIYNGFYEYTISRYSESIDSVYHIDGLAYVNAWTQNRVGSATVRPTFYLDASTLYFSGTGTSSDPYQIGNNFDYNYKPEAQEFTAPVEGYYQVELWGASGGSSSEYKPGYGAYTKGIIYLKNNDKLYIYTGQQGIASTVEESFKQEYFNGGASVGVGYVNPWGGTGGGATDIRLQNGNWNDFNSLKSRIMVAAGGGAAGSRGASFGDGKGGDGGALKGLDGESINNTETSSGYGIGYGATQISGGKSIFYGKSAVSNKTFEQITSGFGYADSIRTNDGYVTDEKVLNNYNWGPWSTQVGGGGGYYGGGSSLHGSAGGGSSYISGYKGCVAIKDTSSEENIISKCTEDNAKNNIECSYHYSGKVFTSPLMIAGNSLMPSPNGANETGHIGNGYARITLLNEKESLTKAIDLSSNHFDGVFKGNVQIKQDGADGYGLYFGGNESYVELPTLPASIDWNSGFTIEFEAKWHEFNSYSRIFDFGNGENKDNLLVCHDGGINQFRIHFLHTNNVNLYLEANKKIKIKLEFTKTGENNYVANIYENDVLKDSVVYNNLANLNVERKNNYLGKSNWYAEQVIDGYLHGYIYWLKITDINNNPILWYDFT